jgi:hypothetical protein
MTPAWVYSPARRWLEALLRSAAYATALALALDLLASQLGGEGEPVTARAIVFTMGLGGLLPYAAAQWLRRAWRGSLSITDSRLAFTVRGATLELDRADVAGLRAWRLPLPVPGFQLLLRQGRPWQVSLPPEAARALGASGAGPLERFALARPAPASRFRWSAAFKLGAFPLFPALVFFRAREVIEYGGFLGEYHRFGLARWGGNLLSFWAVTVAVLAAWAACCRAATELCSLLGAFAGARAAATVRRGAEVTAAVAYYAAALLVLAAVFLR